MSDNSVPALDTVRTCPFLPAEQHRRLQRDAPVSQLALPDGQVVWTLARHADVRTMLGSEKVSANRWTPGFPGLFPTPAYRGRPPFPMLDGAEHIAQRRKVAGEFTAKRLAAFEPGIQRITDELVDAILAGPRPADLVTALSLPLPSLVICELLGVPYTDHEFFQQRTATMMDHQAEPTARHAASQDVMSYIDGLVTAKEEDPTDDLIGRQVLKQRETGEHDHDTLVNLAGTLLVAGHETSANMISLSVLGLLEHPHLISAVNDDPGRWPGTVEELLRYFGIGEFVPSRVATDDLVIGDTTIRAGEGIVPLGNTANRDPQVFPDPDELRIDRSPNPHLTFGHGPHQCLGQNLARLELRIVLGTLFRRIPGLRLAAEVDTLPFKAGDTVYGLHSLPVSW